MLKKISWFSLNTDSVSLIFVRDFVKTSLCPRYKSHSLEMNGVYVCAKFRDELFTI